MKNNDRLSEVLQELETHFNLQGEEGLFGVASEIVEPKRWKGDIQVDFTRLPVTAVLKPDDVVVVRHFIEQLGQKRELRSKRIPRQQPSDFLSYILRFGDSKT